ncbi:porin [Paraburkholderia dipogonis]|uniref:Porin n=1 Tax=Paraburkholderia dipogonis TaxID=1211383 RepID=A0A4Y8MRP0_9BURK|nr:porin [Paraburkholderia dipogonis]TFE40210.1 porin [Paraburkholderia dipogonis]
MNRLFRCLARLTACIGAIFILDSACAQSSVTLYGRLDAGLLYTSRTFDVKSGGNDGHQLSAINSGASPTLFGLQGVENIGGGTKVLFTLESGVSLMDGSFKNSNGNLFGRQAFVALAGPYGQAKFGLQFSPFFMALFETDPRGFSQFGSGLVNYVNNVLGTGAFNANGISYASPSIGGFEGSALVALGGKAGDYQAGRQYSASLKYQNGNFMVNAALYSGNGGGTVSTPIPTTLQFSGRTVGTVYKFGAVSAKAQFVNYKVAGSFNSNLYGLGMDWYATPALNLNGGVYYRMDRNDSANSSIMGALGTVYSLSVRTALYAQVAAINNRGAMNSGLAIGYALYGLQGTTTGATIGIRHTF